MLISSIVRQASIVALLLGLALAVLAPAFAAANGAPDCGMACCRAAGTAMPGMPSMPGMQPTSGESGCATPCGMRGGCGAPSMAVLGGLPPTVMPAVAPLARLAVASPLPPAALHLSARLAADLSDPPPRG